MGDRYFDQIELSGHSGRISDLEHFAAVGLKTLRYPLLWERISPDGPAVPQWAEADRAMHKLRELGVKPIVGLVHHGSGPRDTNLLDPDFPAKLSAFSRAVAARYPWLDSFTPINEPLTTARFAALYGHWYPHARDDRSFVRAVINQCAAIRDTMEAIREIIPNAQLIQTEDLGKTYSTPSLDYQAAFDNNRRWLTFDLLTGRVDEWHPLWWYLLESGAERRELDSFLERPCVPNIVGINYYLTSERFLDDRVELYPHHSVGGNGRHEYADIEAVRVIGEGIAGHESLLREAWKRYELPLAITEVHLGCTREQQLRWLMEAWSDCLALRAENIDVRAVTAWSLLGCFGWSSLLTRDFDRYEPGAFDLRSPSPRPTALASMIRALANKGNFDHPVLDGEGWWRREQRFTYPPYSIGGNHARRTATVKHPERPLVITGCLGTLGDAFRRITLERGLCSRPLTRADLDVADRESVRVMLAELRPWAVINAAGYVRVDDAETNVDACYRENTDGAIMLAEECAERGVRFLTFSSDLVFDGASPRQYVEEDTPAPLNVYGASKAAAESRIAPMHNALIIRTSAFFGPWDSSNFVATMLRALATGRAFPAADDTVVSPTYVPDLVNVSLDLLIDGECGTWHLANSAAITWAEFARRAARLAGLDTSLIDGKPMERLGLAARRPKYSALASGRGAFMPDLDDALARFFATAAPRTHATPVALEGSASV